VTSLFGSRKSPFSGKQSMHNGFDIAAPEGAVIRAPASGQAHFVGLKGGYGNVLIVQHGRGIATLYGHLTKSLIAQGDRFTAGTPIALVGNTGRSTGPHLHYEVRVNNIPVNPKRFLPDEPVEESTIAAPAAAPQMIAADSAWPSEPVPAEQAIPSMPVPVTLTDEISPGI
jgi:murein DD-endopeptidase MepM/ murein hydrolase activator NlpD